MNNFLTHTSKIMLIALLFLFNFADMLSDGPCDPNNCNPTEWASYSRSILLSAFPECPIDVVYETRECSPIKEIRINGFSFYPNGSADCQAILDYMRDASGQYDYEAINDLLRMCMWQLANDIFTDLYNDLDPSTQLAFNCAPNQLFKQYSAYWSTCLEYQICFDFQSGSPWTLETVPCDEKSCCVQEIKACWDTQYSEPQLTVYSIPVSDDCGEPESGFDGSCITFGCYPFCDNGAQSRQSIDVEHQQPHSVFHKTTLPPLLLISPNPIDSKATLSFELFEPARAQINIFNVFGREVYTADSGWKAKGKYVETLSLWEMPTGIYALRLIADGVVVGQTEFVISR